MTWVMQFAGAAKETDRFVGRSNHVELLAAGLTGEAGSVVAELKKEQREREAYPAYRRKMLEELGDFLWYFVRLTAVLAPDLVAELVVDDAGVHRDAEPLARFLELGAAVGELVAAVGRGAAGGGVRDQVLRVWLVLRAAAHDTGVGLEAAAENNLRKVRSRWPLVREYAPLFDEGALEEEQLPRKLEIEFRERSRGEQRIVILRCNGINFGDRLTDNITDPDGYRYHDVFHFAYAVHLGWSPVVRALLRCKRKSDPKIDDAQDGARAGIIEEAVSAIAFSRGKQLGFFDGLDHVDYDLLKMVSEFVEGYEVDRIPLWQWEVAILQGFALFRQLRHNRGGRVALDLGRRELKYFAPLSSPARG
jgi:NTP pyrophosphatase (non-canonical NTP hydrolase)